MGKWSQYRHRGRSAPETANPWTEAAPTEGDWSFSGGTGAVHVTDVGPPGGISLYLFRCWLTSTPDVVLVIGPNDSSEELAVFRDPGEYQAQIAWYSSAGQVSDWGDIKTASSEPP